MVTFQFITALNFGPTTGSYLFSALLVFGVVGGSMYGGCYLVGRYGKMFLIWAGMMTMVLVLFLLFWSINSHSFLIIILFYLYFAGFTVGFGLFAFTIIAELLLDATIPFCLFWMLFPIMPALFFSSEKT